MPAPVLPQITVNTPKLYAEWWRKFYPRGASQALQFHLFEHLFDQMHLGDVTLPHPCQYRFIIRLAERKFGLELVRTTRFFPWATKGTLPASLPLSRYTYNFHPEVYPDMQKAVAAWGTTWGELVTECQEDKFLSDYERKRKLGFWRKQFTLVKAKWADPLCRATAQPRDDLMEFLDKSDLTNDMCRQKIEFVPWYKK